MKKLLTFLLMLVVGIGGVWADSVLSSATAGTDNLNVSSPTLSVNSGNSTITNSSNSIIIENANGLSTSTPQMTVAMVVNLPTTFQSSFTRLFTWCQSSSIDTSKGVGLGVSTTGTIQGTAAGSYWNSTSNFTTGALTGKHTLIIVTNNSGSKLYIDDQNTVATATGLKYQSTTYKDIIIDATYASSISQIYAWNSDQTSNLSKIFNEIGGYDKALNVYSQNVGYPAKTHSSRATLLTEINKAYVAKQNNTYSLSNASTLADAVTTYKATTIANGGTVGMAFENNHTYILTGYNTNAYTITNTAYKDRFIYANGTSGTAFNLLSSDADAYKWKAAVSDDASTLESVANTGYYLNNVALTNESSNATKWTIKAPNNTYPIGHVNMESNTSTFCTFFQTDNNPCTYNTSMASITAWQSNPKRWSPDMMIEDVNPTLPDAYTVIVNGDATGGGIALTDDITVTNNQKIYVGDATVTLTPKAIDGYYITGCVLSTTDKTITITYTALPTAGFYKITHNGSVVTYGISTVNKTGNANEQIAYYDGTKLMGFNHGTFMSSSSVAMGDASSAGTITFVASANPTGGNGGYEYSLNIKVGEKYWNGASMGLVDAPSTGTEAYYTNFKVTPYTDLTPYSVTISGADGSITPKDENYAGYTPIKNGGLYGASTTPTAASFTVADMTSSNYAAGIPEIDATNHTITVTYKGLDDLKTEVTAELKKIGRPLVQEQRTNLENAVSATEISTLSSAYTAYWNAVSSSTSNELYLPSGYYYMKSMGTNINPYAYNNYLKTSSKFYVTIQNATAVTSNNGLWHITNNGTNISIVNGEGTALVQSLPSTDITYSSNVMAYSTLNFKAYDDAAFNSIGGIYFNEAPSATGDSYYSFTIDGNSVQHLTTWMGWDSTPKKNAYWTFEAPESLGTIYTVTITGPDGTKGAYITRTETSEIALNGGFFACSSTPAITDFTAYDIDGYSSSIEIAGNTITVTYTGKTISGTVSNGTDVIANAKVQIIDSSSNTTEVTTGTDGTFSSMVAAGSYTVKVKANGYYVSSTAADASTANVALGTIKLSALPFMSASSTDDITTWYELRMNRSPQRIIYWDGTNIATPSSAAAKTKANRDNYMWAFIGNSEDGFCWYNKGQNKYVTYGATNINTNDAQGYLTDTPDAGSYFDLEKNGNVTTWYFFKIHNSTSNYVSNNGSKTTLRTWTTKDYGDVGSQIVIDEIYDYAIVTSGLSSGGGVIYNNEVYTTSEKLPLPQSYDATVLSGKEEEGYTATDVSIDKDTKKITVTYTACYNYKYSVTDAAGNTWTGKYNTQTAKAYPTFTGVEGATYSDESFNEETNTYSATVTFPFTVSKADLSSPNYLYIYTDQMSYGNAYFKISGTNIVTRATGQYSDGTYLPTNQSGENEKWEWAIVPTLSDSKFTFKIYNASTQKYVVGTGAVNPVTVGDTGADFCYGTTGLGTDRNGFYLAGNTGVFFAANSTSSGEQSAILWTKSGTTHMGANLNFTAAANFTTLTTNLSNAYNAIIDYTIGTGVGKYTATGDFTTAKTQATAILADESTTYATATKFETYTANLAKTNLTINQPAAGFYRIKFTTNETKPYFDSAQPSSDNQVAMSSLEDASTIYYLEEVEGQTNQKYLLAYSNGYYLANPWRIGVGTEIMPNSSKVYKQAITINEGAVGKYSLKYDDTNYFTGNGANAYFESTLSVNGNAWTFVPVDELPLTTNADGYATFSAPVALTIPTTGTLASDETKSITCRAFIAASKDDASTVSMTKVTDNIPANTGIILRTVGGATNLSFPIIASSTTDVSGNMLVSVVAAANVAKSDNYFFGKVSGNYLFALLSGDDTHALGGHKCYLDGTKFTSEARGNLSISWDDDTPTNIDSIDATDTIADGKYIENGHVVIVKNGQKFNTNGQMIK